MLAIEHVFVFKVYVNSKYAIIYILLKTQQILTEIQSDSIIIIEEESVPNVNVLIPHHSYSLSIYIYAGGTSMFYQL